MITFTNVSKRYGSGASMVPAVEDVSFTLPQGSFTAILGSSGSGKSTLLHLIGGIDRPTRGTVEVAGRDLSTLSDRDLARYRNQAVGFVFQSFFLLPGASVLENVLLPRVYGGKRPARKARAAQLLRAFGLGDKLARRPGELSGGEQQRVAIARALMQNPRVILADEPTGNLDSRTGQHIIEILSWLHQHGRTVVLVTHDLALASRAQYALHLRDGRIENPA